MVERNDSSPEAIKTRERIEAHFGWQPKNEVGLAARVEETKVFPEEADHPAARLAAQMFLIRFQEFMGDHPSETITPDDLDATFNNYEASRRTLHELSAPGYAFVPLTLRELWGATTRRLSDGREAARVSDSRRWVSELPKLQRIRELVEDALPEDQRPDPF